MNTNQTAVTHYTATGNAYWGVEFTGFCGSRSGLFTDYAEHVSCAKCRDEIAAVRVRTNSRYGVPAYTVPVVA